MGYGLALFALNVDQAMQRWPRRAVTRSERRFACSGPVRDTPRAQAIRFYCMSERNLVIPGRPEGANPESGSRRTDTDSGPANGRPRNDEQLVTNELEMK